MRKLLSIKNIVISFAGLILLWQIVYSVSGFSKALFPAPYHAWEALGGMFLDGSIFINIGSSMYRFALGYIGGIFAAVFAGLFLGYFPGYSSTLIRFYSLSDPSLLWPGCPLSYSGSV